MKSIEPLVLSRSGPLLIHAHANGYPPQAYRCFLTPFLKDYQVKAIYLRPFWPRTDPESLSNWRVFRDDYLRELPGLLQGAGPGEGVIGMGHSLGAVTTLMAAIADPGAFRALVLIEPTLFSPLLGLAMRAMAPLRLFRRFHPLVSRTLRRKTSFPDRESMFANYRGKSIFSGIPDEVLWDYVQGLAQETEGGRLTLKYRPLWEARIYETGGSVDREVMRHLEKVTCPVLILRGERSDTLEPRIVERMVEKLPLGQAVHVPGVGHLLPLEDPPGVARIALDFLDGALG